MRRLFTVAVIVSIAMVSLVGCKGEPKGTGPPKRHPELLTDVERLIASGKDINSVRSRAKRRII